MEVDDEDEDDEDEDDYVDGPSTSGLDGLHRLAHKLSGSFTIGPAQRTNWSKFVYESNEGNELSKLKIKFSNIRWHK